MSDKPRELVLLSRARRALAEARTVHDLKSIRDVAKLAKGWAKKMGLAEHIILEASATNAQCTETNS